MKLLQKFVSSINLHLCHSIRMDATQLFATGGVSGVTALAFYLIYRFLFSKHRIVSKCCGKELSIDVEASPKEKPLKNIAAPINV